MEWQGGANLERLMERHWRNIRGTTLGFGWSTAEDMLEVRFRVDTSEHRRGNPTGPDLTVVTLHQLDTAVVTKRVCLRVASSRYDPLGIAYPLLIILKCSLKELYTMDLSSSQCFHFR